MYLIPFGGMIIFNNDENAPKVICYTDKNNYSKVPTTTDLKTFIRKRVKPNSLKEQKIRKRNNKVKEALTKIKRLDRSNEMNWFIKYKKIQEEYSKYLDKDETIYDIFSENELSLLFRIVEAEVRGDTYFIEKVHVANVIFNRLMNEGFPNDLIGVLTQKNQFSSYSSNIYKSIEINETTIIACEYAFQIKDTTNGALWFDSTNGNSWASKNRTYIFTDNVGHTFYK